MSVLSDLIAWSQELPAWQSDAMRRLFEKNGELSDAEQEEVLTFLKQEHGIDLPAVQAAGAGQSATAPILLAAPQLTVAQVGEQPVVLLKLSDVKNVNRLAEGEEITFSPNGITIIFGANASGKSGYSRILKKACRARDAGGSILPNVYDATSAGRAEAVFTLQVGEVEMAEKWVDGTPSAAHLTRIAVFDSKCSRLFVDERNEIDYVPYGLDVLVRLAQLQEALMAKINMDVAALPNLPDELSRLNPSTSTARFLASLSATTTEEQMVQFATLTDEEVAKMGILKTRIDDRKKNNVHERIAILTRKKARLEQFLQRLKIASVQLGAANTANLKTTFDAYLDLKKASEVLSQQSFTSEPLAGVGTDAWRAMFMAARKFSEQEAYCGQDFPVMANGSRCVLCHQELSEEATDRMRRFDQFVRNETEVQRKIQHSKLETEWGPIARLDLSPLSPEHDDAFSDLSFDEAWRESAQTFLCSAGVQRDAIQKSIYEEKWIEIPVFPIPDAARLESYIGSLQEEIQKLNSTVKPQEWIDEEQEYTELSARDALRRHHAAVASRIQALNKNAKLQKCLDALSTRKITLKQKVLMETSVIEPLAINLKEEMGKLNLKSIEVDLQTSGAKGSVHSELKLAGVNAGKVRNPSEILSEGEERVLGIAAFLAEIKTNHHLSGIVFDDPVSSLDHNFREEVARRLVQESMERQVIIFTHDLVFWGNLMEQIRFQRQSNVVQHFIEKRGAHVGMRIADECNKPLQMLCLDEMVRNLKQRLVQIKKLRGIGGGVYQQAVASAYSFLRQAWERVIEEKLLCGVVQRFTVAVRTQSLKTIQVTVEDCAKIDEAVTKCSRITEAHSSPAAVGVSTIEPEEFEVDITLMENFISEIKARRQQHP